MPFDTSSPAQVWSWSELTHPGDGSALDVVVFAPLAGLQLVGAGWSFDGPVNSFELELDPAPTIAGGVDLAGTAAFLLPCSWDATPVTARLIVDAADPVDCSGYLFLQKARART